MKFSLGKKAPSGLIALFGKHPGMDDKAEEDDEGDDPLAVSDEHVDAMREFDKAKSPEERAQALMAFIRLSEGD